MATSLEILRPTPSPSIKRSSRNPTTLDLETRSTTIASSLSTHDFSNPDLKRWLTSDFRAEVDITTSSGQTSRIPIVGRDAYLSQLRRNRVKDVEIVDVSANVDEEAGLASVWMLLSVERRETVTVFLWRREIKKTGVWRCYQQTCMRGVSGFRI